MCLTRMEELESCLSGLLSTLKKNREHVPLEVLKTQYKQPYEELVRNINLTASAYAKSVLLHRLVLNPDADVEEQCTVINQMIQTSGMLKKISSCMSKTYDVGQMYPLILELRHMVAGTTSPYSLYNESLASFTTGDMYDHHDADGFITLFGLPLKVRAMKMQEAEKNNNK